MVASEKKRRFQLPSLLPIQQLAAYQPDDGRTADGHGPAADAERLCPGPPATINIPLDVVKTKLSNGLNSFINRHQSSADAMGRSDSTTGSCSGPGAS
jgi:hypothetical protein